MGDYIATSEVTTLQHELRDNAVEFRACISKVVLFCAECTEVLCGYWDFLIEKLEIDPLQFFIIFNGSAAGAVSNGYFHLENQSRPWFQSSGRNGGRCAIVHYTPRGTGDLSLLQTCLRKQLRDIKRSGKRDA